MILPLAGGSAALYALLAVIGPLQGRLPLFFGVHAVLLVFLGLGWRLVRRGGDTTYGLALGAALVFRLIAALGPPSLSDDVYRYVWDGHVQVHRIHPYRYAPDDAALASYRDQNWQRINHPELISIYPPLAQLVFRGLASIGAGPRGFKLGMGLLDFGVVCAMGLLLGKLKLPRERILLYAWNPLAVMETAGSGHIEPLGVLLVVLASAWVMGGRPGLSSLALAGAIHAKLLPVVLLPGYLRRWRLRELLFFGIAIIGLALPYALAGPVLGEGTQAYAAHWERNAFAFAGVRGTIEWSDPVRALETGLATLQKRLAAPSALWEFLYRHIWPEDLARGFVALVALAWVITLSFRKGLSAARETFLDMGGVLLLSPTLHPWYLLWVLPFASAYLSRGWLLLAALAPLAYVGAPGDVPWGVRCVEYLPPLVLLAWDGLRGPRRGRGI